MMELPARLPVYLVLGLMLAFVGDHYTGAIPSFALIFFAYVAARAVLGPSLYRGEIVAVLLALLALSVPMAVEMLQGRWPGYAFGYVQLALSISPFYVIGGSLRHSDVRVSGQVALVIALCFLAATLLISADNFVGSMHRARFFFGPNVMYRIYGVLAFLFYFIVFRGQGRVRLLAKSLIFVAMALGCLATGSRGGLVTIVIFGAGVAFIEYFDRRDMRPMRLGLFAASGAVLALLVVVLARIGGFRAARFNPANNSEAERIGNYVDFQKYLAQADWTHLLFGTASGNGPYDFYPHNAFVEAVVWGGLFPTLVLLVAAAWLLGAFVVGSTAARFYAAMGIVILVGAQFSGGLLDNYAFMALGLAGLALAAHPGPVRSDALISPT